jgi:hypothetical protein
MKWSRAMGDAQAQAAAQIEALDRLIKAVEADRDIWDCVLAVWPMGTSNCDGYAVRAFNGSLDAAKALHDALLPGWAFSVSAHEALIWLALRKKNPVYAGFNKTASSRAWLIAVLRAYRTKLAGGG